MRTYLQKFWETHAKLFVKKKEKKWRVTQHNAEEIRV
jgi:hypothetical protein